MTDDDYYGRIQRSRDRNTPGWQKFIAKNIAGGLAGLLLGMTFGVGARFYGTYGNLNFLDASITSTIIYEGIRLVRPDKAVKRDMLMTGKSKLRVILEDTPGFFLGAALGYSSASLIPGISANI